MIVVSNTSPLNYLILLRRDYVLPDLFSTVVAPPTVIAELSRERTPEIVRHWISTPPQWLRIQAPQVIDDSLELDAGEREAISLAIELGADRILLDEAKARRAAVSRGLRVAGTLAVLFEAAERGLLDMELTIGELRQTTFYLDEKILESIVARIRGRRM